MRPSQTVARAALTAALALAALPGLVGSHQPTPNHPVDAALFDNVTLANTPPGAGRGSFVLDEAGLSDGVLDAAEPFSEAGTDRDAATAAAAKRATPKVAAAAADWSWNPARSTMTGAASFYDFGTTAMRLPRGTVIVICGAGGCIERVVNDYGPAKSTGRIIDMYRPDFFRICGCGWWSGTTTVTVRVY
ncbi:MAG TPA: hypothetical protein VFP56_02990 [Candidatus Limnocylindrales bacterium]|nr:hypothetical protein [Candidatus Limnocylindrales bacterium]